MTGIAHDSAAPALEVNGLSVLSGAAAKEADAPSRIH